MFSFLAFLCFVSFFGIWVHVTPSMTFERLGIKRVTQRNHLYSWYFLACYFWAIGPYFFWGECELYILLFIPKNLRARAWKQPLEKGETWTQTTNNHQFSGFHMSFRGVCNLDSPIYMGHIPCWKTLPPSPKREMDSVDVGPLRPGVTGWVPGVCRVNSFSWKPCRPRKNP